MSKTVAMVAVLAMLCAVNMLWADARVLQAAEYSPYNAQEEATETPAYKAEETYKGQGLYYGEAYAPNAPSLLEAAAIVPAPEGAYLVKIANQITPGGAPAVRGLIDAARSSRGPAEAPVGSAKLEAAEKAAPALRNQPQPALKAESGG